MGFEETVRLITNRPRTAQKNAQQVQPPDPPPLHQLVIDQDFTSSLYNRLLSRELLKDLSFYYRNNLSAKVVLESGLAQTGLNPIDLTRFDAYDIVI